MIKVMSDEEWDTYRKHKTVTYWHADQMRNSFGLEGLLDASVVCVEARNYLEAIKFARKLLGSKHLVQRKGKLPVTVKLHFECVVVY